MQIANIPEVKFSDWLFNQGPVIIFLALAVYLVGRALVALSAKLDAAKSQQLQEHKERIDKLEQRNEEMEKRLDECEDDRRDLRRQLAHLVKT
jgi:septal ring factor EnvC (AmiA/AmiB activator)